MQFFRLLIALFRDLSNAVRWQELIQYVGQGSIYGVLFAIIFAETGLVVTPFLPGDSLLFAVGAICAKGDVGLNLPLLAVLLSVAAVAGDAVNYWIGYRLGPRVFKMEDDEFAPAPANSAPGLDYAAPAKKRTLMQRMLNKKHLLRAQEFYDKYGGKTIILARFVPVVRTFAPFVAGVGKMNYVRFFLFNVVGGVAWVLICLTAGYVLGRREFIQKHFEMVIVAIVVISVLPIAVELLRSRRTKGPAVAPAAGTPGGAPVTTTPEPGHVSTRL